MSFKLETQQIVPGGVNLLAPGDQIADGDCLEALGWRCDTIGKLVQAKQSVAIASDGAALDSVARVAGRRYYGGGGSLWAQSRGTISTSLDAIPLGLVGYQGWLWVINSGVQRKDNGSNTFQWTPNPPANAPGAVASGGGGLPEGACDYYITFTNDFLHESNPSPVQTLTLAADDKVVITPDATGKDDQSTHYNVYRKDSTMAVPYRVNQDPVVLASTFTDSGTVEDNQDSEYLVDNRPALEGNHDAAPPAKVAADREYNGRLVVANSVTHPNRIWWTPALRPWFFPGSGVDNQDAANWLDVGDGDSILAITVHPRFLLIYTSRNVWRHSGDLGTGSVEMVASDIGIVGPRAVVSTSKGDYVRAADGIYLINGDFGQKLSSKLDPVFRGQNTKIADTQTISAENGDHIDRCALGFRSGRLYVSYTTGAGTNNDAAVVLHLETGRWARTADAYNAYLDEGQLGSLIGVSGTTLAYCEGGYAGHGLAWQTRYEDQGRPDRIKTYADLVINHNTQGATLTVAAWLNNGRASADHIILDATLVSSALTKQIVPLVYPVGHAQAGQPIQALNLAIRVDGAGYSGSGELPVEIQAPVILHYYLEPRKAKRFDSSPIDHGVQSSKVVDEVELDIDNTDGEVTLQIYSDIPGGTLAIRLGAGMAVVAGGRRRVPLVLSSPIEGRLLRYLVTFTKTSPGPLEGFHLYSFRVRYLVIGVSRDGAQSEKWVTEPLPIGV